MSEPTDLFLPPQLPYPIRIVAHAVQPSADIERGTRLLSYSFTHTSPESGTETRFGTWDSSLEGTVDSWNFKVGETISERRAKEVAAITIIEPCKHGIQLGGLCALCGKDMTDFDYTGFSDASRASIQMTHTANGPTVSLEEAKKLEKKTAEHLQKSRKLSLIVDLDQTIVHATVDPTVGEWILEGEAWEARAAKRAEKAAIAKDKKDDDEDEDEDDSDSDSDEDEVNPNWEALKDVKKFRLSPEALGQSHQRKTKDKSVENDGCMYYIKPRPGWKEFLQEMSTKYEMHVYTMGTRVYAEEVCAAIDPDGEIFGGRLISRDESESLTQKSLQRLFPSDQSMVVVIDDRADVWGWGPNLIKVIPYDFFIGIGDINSAFLPKLEPLAPNLPPEAPKGLAGGSQPSAPQQNASSATSAKKAEPASTARNDLTSMSKDEILARNADVLEAQVEERPLAKMQEELQDAQDTQEAKQTENAPLEANGIESANTTEQPRSTTPKPEKHVRKPLLRNDDAELARVQKLLEVVHKRYYDAYDARSTTENNGKRKSRQDSDPIPYDVRLIIPELRHHTLEGTHILFSSVIPLDTRPDTTEIWRTAQAFGAHCYTELNNKITHVVAAKRGTMKVDAARRQGGIKIVWLAWFTDSVALWHRQDEGPYLIDPEGSAPVGPASPPSDPHQISSDPEPDADDWDNDDNTSRQKSLALDEVDWDEVNDEVEAAMNESEDDDDDNDEESTKDEVRSANASEDEWTDETNSVAGSVSSTPRKKRKRLRSITPSEYNSTTDPDVLRSPLAKRKKIAADRVGASKLKEGFLAEDLVERNSTSSGKRSAPASVTGEGENEEEDDDDEMNEEEEEEDDFLARELGDEDWG